MPDAEGSGRYPDPREEDIIYEDRRISRPDASLPDWEVPDSTYRPLPIVWFTGALLLQAFGQGILLAISHAWLGLPPALTVAIALLASGLIWQHTMLRGMESASFAWRLALALMLAFFFSLTALTAFA